MNYNDSILTSKQNRHAEQNRCAEQSRYARKNIVSKNDVRECVSSTMNQITRNSPKCTQMGGGGGE